MKEWRRKDMRDGEAVSRRKRERESDRRLLRREARQKREGALFSIGNVEEEREQ